MGITFQEALPPSSGREIVDDLPRDKLIIMHQKANLFIFFSLN